MASQASLESSLRRCAILGLDVLERASRRSVDWTSNPSETPTQETDEGHSTHTTLDDALESIAEFMTQTTHQCKKFYLDPTHKATENERAHVCRYHSHQRPLAQHLGPESTRSSWDQRSSTLRCLHGHTA